ncbi:MAG TPA: VWA domain-containing protein [Gaiellaceae bacterium]
MRRTLVFAVLSLIVATSLAGGAAASGNVSLTEAKGSAFPNRSFVLALPTSRALTAGDLNVTENGNSVADVSLISAAEANKRAFGVVLVIDASESMAGKPIAGAIAAARAFANKRNPHQQLALVTFNGTTNVALPFTTDNTTIRAALAQVPSVAYGTHIYDAVSTAEALLNQAHIQSGSILLLSDGADTGSVHQLGTVAKVARIDRIKIYAIGLKSKKFDPSTLTALASKGQGEYALATSTSQLAPLFDTLGAKLSQEYVLKYKSLAAPQKRIVVGVQVFGIGTATAGYETPQLKLPVVPPYHPSLASRFTTSPLIMVLFALLLVAAVTWLAIALLQPRSTDLPKRMAEFVSVPGLQRKGQAGPQLTDDAAAQEEAKDMWGRFERKLEIANIKASPASIVLGTIVGTILAFLFLDVVLGSIWWTLFALLVPIGVREWVNRTLAKRRSQFAEQLPDALQVISSALRSGHSFAGALAVVVESASEPMKSEMQRVVADEQLGIPLEQAIEVVVNRMDSRDLEQVGIVAQLQRESGSNAAEVVDRVAETIRERFELRRLIKTLTVQGRMSRWIVSALPVVILLLLQLINPHYMHPLVASLGGKIVLGFAAALCVGGSLVIKKIVDIKV